jgi:hypothetical protein
VFNNGVTHQATVRQAPIEVLPTGSGCSLRLSMPLF